MISNTLTLTSVPELVVAWVSPQSYQAGDGAFICCPVTATSISFANQQSLLAADSSVEVLFRRTQKAGITVPWLQYAGGAYSQAANGFVATAGAPWL